MVIVDTTSVIPVDNAIAVCYSLPMTERIKRVLKGVASTMDLYPARRPIRIITDPAERLRRPWERTGQALQRAIDRFEREQTSK